MREITPEDFDDGELAQQPKTSPVEREYIPLPGSPEFRNLQEESAKLRMLEYVYQTPPERLPEMTFLGAHEPHTLASMIMFDAMSQPDYIIGSAFTIWRNAFFSLRRSVRGEHIKKGYGLAEAGMLTEEKEATGMAMEAL